VRDWSLLAFLSVLWGGSFFFNGVVLRELPPLTLVFLRVALAALILLPLMRAYRLPFPQGISGWRPFFAVALFNNVLPFSLIVIGQTFIPSGLASILNATTPLFTVLVAHWATADEKLNAPRLAGVAAGLAGVIVMIGPDLRDLGANVLGQFAVLLAAVSYAFAGVYGRRFRGEPPLRVAAGQLVASSMLLAPVAILIDRPWTLPAPGMATIAALVALAALSTALAYLIYFRILARAGATNVLLVTFLIPVSAILLGTLLLGEQLEVRHLVGMAAIGIGLAAIDGRPAKWAYRVGTGFSPR
jgi:drug/metabolite transporter (DMT)-like permease